MIWGASCHDRVIVFVGSKIATLLTLSLQLLLSLRVGKSEAELIPLFTDGDALEAVQNFFGHVASLKATRS